MKVYRAVLGEGYTDFDNPEDCQNCIALFNGKLEIINRDDPLKVSIDFRNGLGNDLAFGIELINQFLLDNRELPRAYSTIEKMAMLQKFNNIKELAYLGDIHIVYFLLKNLECDPIFTQERKDTYLGMCRDYLKI